ncbi:MAG: peptide deformylase [Candidatus Taylorbacteria bacterium]|nr:peptide deformylase [Candidatus Taylorbacteria bacterium]
MVAIVQKDDPVLRLKASPVPAALFDTPKLRKIVKDMKAALASQDDGVAIAAPQIGVSLRIFVVSGRIFEMLYPDRKEEDGKKAYPDVVFINPEISKLSKEREEMEEGCLSVRYLYGKIVRAKKAKVKAFDEKGQPFEIGGSGLLAQIFQHETDHLEGRLFIDQATDIQDLPPKDDK